MDKSDILGDVIEDDAYTKSTFVEVYESEGLDVLAQLMNKVFSGISEERKRRRGAADGFRATE